MDQRKGQAAGGGLVMYKCCWNCWNGFTAYAPAMEEKVRRFNASRRFCCASYTVSSHGENPFKQRYCKQFAVPIHGVTFGHEITKREAEKLQQMSVNELMEYWNRRASDV